MPLRTWPRTSWAHSQFICNRLQQKILSNALESIRVTAKRSVINAPHLAAMRASQAPPMSHRPYTTNSASSTNPQSTTITEEKAKDDHSETSEKLRKVLRKVPFPVVVVSTSSPHDPSLRRGITISSFSSISLQPIPLVSFCVKLPSRASTILHESDQFVIQFLASDQIAHSVAFSSSVPPPPSVTAALSNSGSGSESDINPLQVSAPTASRSKVPKDKNIEELISEASSQTLIEGKSETAQLPSDVNLSNNTNGTSSSGSSYDESSSTSTETDPDPFEVLGYRTDPESNLPVLLNTLGAIRCRTHKVTVVGDHEMWIGHVEKVLHGEIPDQQEPLLYHDRSYRKVGRRIL